MSVPGPPVRRRLVTHVQAPHRVAAQNTVGKADTPSMRPPRPIEVAQALGEISHALSDHLPLADLLDRLVAAAGTLLRVDRSSVFLYGEDRYFSANASWGVGGPAVRLSSELTAVERELRDTGRPVIIHDALAVEPNPYFERLGILSSMSVPMMVDNAVIGMLCLHSTRAQRHFTEGDVVLASAFASQAAVAILNGQLYARVRSSHDRMLALYQTGREMGASLEVRRVGELLVQAALQLTDASAAALTFRDSSPVGPCLAGDPAFVGWRSEAPASELPSMRVGVPDPPSIAPGCPDDLVGWSLELDLGEGASASLEVYARDPQPLLEGRAVLLALAQHASSALQNAHLFGSLSDARGRLDGLLEALMQAREEEARRVAYDVHDGIAQILVAADHHLQAARAAAAVDDRATLRDEVAAGRELVAQGIREARAIVNRLHPPGLDELGLAEAVRSHCADVSRTTAMEIDLSSDLGSTRLPPAVEVVLFRVIQEALTNAHRHGEATNVHVEIRRERLKAILVIDDDGVGLDASRSAKPSSLHPDHGMGISGMKERTRLVGGELSVGVSPSGGVRVAAWVPLSVPRW